MYNNWATLQLLAMAWQKKANLRLFGLLKFLILNLILTLILTLSIPSLSLILTPNPDSYPNPYSYPDPEPDFKPNPNSVGLVNLAEFKLTENGRIIEIKDALDYREVPVSLINIKS